jgi:hypothetical protein
MYIGEDVSVFLTNSNGGSVESTANFKYNSINDVFLQIDTETNEHSLSFEEQDLKSQLKEQIEEFEKTRKNIWEHDNLREQYSEAIHNYMEQDPNTKNLTDQEFDYIITRILDNENIDKLTDYDYADDTGATITIDTNYYPVVIKHELEHLSIMDKIDNNFNEHQFIVIKSNDNTASFTQGADMTYKNNDIYMYPKTANVDSINNSINADLKNNTSKLTSELLSFDDMQTKHGDLLINHLTKHINK